MNTKRSMFAIASVWLGSIVAATAQPAGPAVPDQLKVSIDTQQTSPPISKYLYGQFIEHIGSTMYSSLWAEMLDDRKFYFPITAQETESLLAPRKAALSECGFASGILSAPKTWFRWTQASRLWATRARALPSTPRRRMASSKRASALLNGKKYTGRIYLRGTPGSKVECHANLGRGRRRPPDHYHSGAH